MSKKASTKGRIIQGMNRPKEALSKGRNIRDFAFVDTSVGDALSRHPKIPLKKPMKDNLSKIAVIKILETL
jgi:hypothetical protein